MKKLSKKVNDLLNELLFEMIGSPIYKKVEKEFKKLGYKMKFDNLDNLNHMILTNKNGKVYNIEFSNFLIKL